MSGPNESDVAHWMLAQVKSDDILHQESAACSIADNFGDEFTYYNDNGNLAISPAVLKAFRALTDDDIVWSRSERCWRKREPHDDPGRMQY